MSRYILIERCSSCPHRDHKGAFGRNPYIPVCGLANNKELSWTAEASIDGRGNAVAYAQATEVIPDWCPLQKTTS